jgi:DNA-binding beta-propeller fold protein YncE
VAVFLFPRRPAPHVVIRPPMVFNVTPIPPTLFRSDPMKSVASFVIVALCSAAVSAQKIELVAGGGNEVGSPKPAKQFKFIGPFGIDFRGDEAYIVELEGGRLHRWDMKADTVTTLGGKLETKGEAGDGGPVAGAVFNGMHSVAVQPGTGDVYIADTWNARVRKLDPKTGVITHVAGTGDKKFTGDGPALKAGIGEIFCIAFNKAGDKIVMTSLTSKRILLLDVKSGTVTSVAGNGSGKTIPKDGSIAKDAPLVDPRAAAMDSQGNIYILERTGNALRVVDTQGRIRTVVNATGKKGDTGDGGPALAATMNGPKHITVDHDDTVLIADAENHLVRRYHPKTGLITRVAGTGKKGTAGLGGDPTHCELSRPHGVTVHPDGALYIVDSYNHRILKITK